MTQSFQKEYTDELIDIIEFLYGKDYLSQGGLASVERMLEGIDLQNKIVADIGCGTGGPLTHIAAYYPISSAIGIDVDADLLQRAEHHANVTGVTNIKWIQSQPEQTLPLETESVDVIVGKESWLHIKNKAFFFKEIYRALKPGGIFVCVDWMHRNASYSNLMKQFVFMDGLTFNLCTIKAYLQYIHNAGFIDVTHEENSHFALEYSRKDVEQLCDPEVAQQFKQRFGEEALDVWLCSWLMQCEVFGRGEMQTFFVIGKKA